MSTTSSRSGTPDRKDHFPSPSPFDTPAPIAPTNPTSYTQKKFERELARWNEDLQEYNDKLADVWDERGRYVIAFRQEREKQAAEATAKIKAAKCKRALEDRGEGSSRGPHKKRKEDDDEDDDPEVSSRFFNCSFFL